MRSLRATAAASLGLATALLLGGCNAIFGLDAVAQREPVDGGGSGGGKECPSVTVTDNLIANPSFEKNSAWTTEGEDVVFDYAPADDCSFACGSRVGHIAVKAGGDTGSVNLYQSVSRKIELGGTLALSARYRYAATNSPYFALIVNGYHVGMPYIHGMNEGEHFAIDKVEVPVLDPRRTGEGVRAGLSADFDAAGLDASVDCVALTYTPPPGAQVLLNGWFDGSTSAWLGDNGATLKWDAEGGLCGSGAAHVMVPASSPNAEIRSAVEGTWPAKTTFRFGGAAKPLADTNGNLAVLSFALSLHVEYQDDGNAQTSEIDDLEFPAESNSEAWQRMIGEFKTERPVTTVGIRIRGSSTVTPGEFLADCSSLRALPP
jgi:hypothetical protein